MKNTTKLALLLLAIAAVNSAAAQQAVKTPPEGKAYTIRSTDAAMGSGTVTYQWYRNDVPITDATEANYTVPAHEAYGLNVEFRRRAECNGADEGWSNAVLVSFLPDLSSKITGSTTVCPNQTGIAYSVINVAGTTYAWTVPAGWTITAGQGTNSITVTAGSAGGTVSVTPTSATGGAGTPRTLNVSVSGAQSYSITGSTAVCAGATGLTYSVTNVQGAAYAWTVPAGWEITAGQGTNSITVTAGSTGGTVSVASYRCSSNSTSTLTVGVGGTPAKPSDIIGIASVCSGQSYTYSVTNVGITYTWAVPAGWNITSGQGTNSITVTASAVGGTISVTPSTICGGSGQASLLSVAVAPAPNQPSTISSNTTAICPGQTGITYSVYGTSGITYTWTVPSGWNITAGQGTYQITVTAGSAGGNVSVTPSVCGNVGGSRTRAVTVGSAPSQPSYITANADIICSEQSYTYSVTNVSGVSYAWTVPSGWEITAGQGTSSITVTAGSANGNVSVTPSNCGGSGTAQTRSVAVNSAPAQPSTITTNNAAPCSGQTGITYYTGNVSGVSYAWTVPNGWSITAGQGSASITVTAGSANGNVQVTPSACGSNGTAQTRAVTVGDPPAQPSSISGSTNNVCSGQSYTYTVGNVKGVSYAWTVPAGWTITAGQGTNSITVTAGGNGGNISVTPSTTCGGSGTVRQQAVTFATAPEINEFYTYEPTSDNEFSPTTTACSGQIIMYLAYPDRYADTYSWTVPSGWEITAGQGSRYVTVKAGSTSGNLSVTASACGGSGTPYVLAVTGLSCGAAPCNSGNSTSIGGTCWASVNVAASGAFAARPDMYTQFYQWNRTTAWAATGSVSSWTETSITDAAWANNGQPPCPSGWRLPTLTELAMLHGSSNPAGGSWVEANERGAAVAGRFYGPNHVTCTLPSNMTSCVFLPAVGYRNTNGSLNYQGTLGYYWSSTQSSSTVGYYLSFGNGSSSINVGSKAYGLLTRCVQ